MRPIGDFFVFITMSIFLSSTCFLCAQESNALKTLSEKLAIYNEYYAPEKVYVQTDKDYYTNGDTLWFKTSIVDGIKHLPSDKSRVVYVELVDPELRVIEQRRIYVGFEGGAGDIALPKNLAKGNYFLRAYTKYMLNESEPVFFEKKIPIWAYARDSKKKRKKNAKKKKIEQALPAEVNEISTSKPIVRFFPEGGNLVTGVNSVLGLKVTDDKGKGIALTGKILNQRGALITMFSTYEFGLGQIQLKAASNTDYFAEIEIDGNIEKYQLPKPLVKGYVLQINNKGEYLQIKVTTNGEDGLKGSLLLGHLRGKKVMEYLAADQTESTYEIKFSTDELDDGVATFTLITPDGEPVCERLVFIENPNNEVKLSVMTDSSNYGFRDQVNVNLAVLDQEGIPLQGNFSLSVVSQNALNNDAENIKTWLLLNSDLGGIVEDPSFFFEEDSTLNRKNRLDILMLTHGWRRFVWHKLGTDKDNKKLRYPPEKGIVINGRTVNSENRTESLKSAVRLSITQPSSYSEESVTDVQGKFSFGPMIFRDSILAVISAVNELDDKKEVAIYLEPSFPNVSFNDSIRFQNRFSTIEVDSAFQKEVTRKKMNDFKYDPNVIRLDEYVGREKLRTKEELINEALNERTMYGQALNRVIPDSILDSEFLSVIDLIQRKVAVYKVEGQYPDQYIELQPYSGRNAIVRGREGIDRANDPLYLLDGIPVDPNLVNQLFGSEILFIDVLKSAGETAQYGSRGRFGVIAVYTDRGENYEFVQERALDVANFTIPGFYRSREFYKPDYSFVNSNQDKPDYRTTLHWQPNIKISDTEQNNVSFFAGDAAGIYVIRVEGIANDGTPVSGLYSFAVKEN